MVLTDFFSPFTTLLLLSNRFYGIRDWSVGVMFSATYQFKEFLCFVLTDSAIFTILVRVAHLFRQERSVHTTGRPHETFPCLTGLVSSFHEVRACTENLLSRKDFGLVFQGGQLECFFVFADLMQNALFQIKTIIMIRDSLLAELRFEAENTRKLFEAIPDDVLDYRPNDFNWSIAELASHIAEIYDWWKVTLEQDVLEMSTYQYDKGDISSMEFIRRKLEENIDQAIASMEDYPEKKFAEAWVMQHQGENLMPPMPRVEVIRGFLMNHLYHHRGEMIALLRVNGKQVPGMYGPSYEEQQLAVG